MRWLKSPCPMRSAPSRNFFSRWKINSLTKRNDIPDTVPPNNTMPPLRSATAVRLTAWASDWGSSVITTQSVPGTGAVVPTTCCP